MKQLKNYMNTSMEKNNKKYIFILVSLTLILIMAVISLSIGSIKIPLKELKDIIIGNTSDGDINFQIYKNIRLPRTIMALIVGANLAVSGTMLQSVMQNPLSDPSIIGVSSGASFGALLVLILFPSYGAFVPIVSFISALLATFLVYILSWRNGIKPIRLILSGVAINSLFGGITSLITVLNSDKIQNVIMWINGSFSFSNWNDLKILGGYSSIGLILSLFTIRSCNILLLGDDKASNLGLNVNKSRILISMIGAYLAAISTSIVGIIGFVGLVIPHITRLMVGSDYKFLLPLSVLNGALFLLITDTLSRTIFSPIELPVGTLMAIIGAPFFLYLLRREKCT